MKVTRNFWSEWHQVLYCLSARKNFLATLLKKFIICNRKVAPKYMDFILQPYCLKYLCSRGNHVSSRMKSDRILMLTKFLNPKAKIFVNFHRLSNSVWLFAAWWLYRTRLFCALGTRMHSLFSSTLKQKVFYTDEDDNTPVFVHNT